MPPRIGGSGRIPLQALVQLQCALEQQKHAAAHEDEITR